jgi:Arc/MetJ-type ribon-helix-helix transcriptional regulator
VGRTEDVERVVVWLDEALAVALDAFVARCGYDSRSDAVRDLIRARVYAADGRSRGRGGSRTAQERRGQARDEPAHSTSAADDEAPAVRSEPVPMTTERLLVAKYGPTMT